MGGYFRGKRWVEITWGDKISASLSTREHWKKASCVNCGKEIMSPGTKRWCSKRCSYEYEKADKDPCAAKARTAGSGIRLGKGKRNIIAGLFRASIDKPCTYCGVILTLENSQIDHLTPVHSLRGTSLAHTLDTIDNLQVICRKCNIAKGEMDDARFRKLLAFLRTDPMIYAAVWRKLGMSGHGWRAIKAGR